MTSQFYSSPQSASSSTSYTGGMRLVPVFLALTLLAAVPASAQRLPGGVTPEHYDLAFVVDLVHERFDGTETIRVNVAAPTTRILLKAADTDFREVSFPTRRNSARVTRSRTR